MATPKKPINSAQREEPENTPGLHLELEHPEKGKLKLWMSKEVALILVPGLLALAIIGGRLWHTYPPSNATPLPPAETVQRQR